MHNKFKISYPHICYSAPYNKNVGGLDSLLDPVIYMNSNK